MEGYQFFNAWVPKLARLAILILMLFVLLCANGVYLGITTEMYSDLGAYPEPFSMAPNALYIGMGGGMMLFLRLAARINPKILIVTSFSMLLLMNFICATTDSPAVAVAASLGLGLSKMLAMGHLYLAWGSVWSKNLDARKIYPSFYFLALGGLNFITWLTTRFSYLYSWRYAYIVISILLISCIVLALITLENFKLKKKIPLYQLDIPGLLLLLTSMMLLNFVVVWGKVEDWFASDAICAASFGAVIALLLFIKRELSLKRPLLDLNLFKRSNVNVGLFLLILLGAITPTTFQSVLTGNILHFELIRNAELNLYLIPGILAGSVLTFFWYRKGFDEYLLITLGFSSMVLYHLLMYTRFVNDLGMADFLVPIFFRGFAQVTLYIALAIFAVKNLPLPSTLKVIGMILIVRSFLSTGVAAGIYNYFVYADTNRHLSRLASQIDANEPMLTQHADFTGYYKYILQQANLSALKEISGSIIIFGLSIIIILILVLAYRKIRKGVLATA
jgi:DHA2 family multidrug resistance protein